MVVGDGQGNHSRLTTHDSRGKVEVELALEEDGEDCKTLKIWLISYLKPSVRGYLLWMMRK